MIIMYVIVNSSTWLCYFYFVSIFLLRNHHCLLWNCQFIYKNMSFLPVDIFWILAYWQRFVKVILLSHDDSINFNCSYGSWFRCTSLLSLLSKLWKKKIFISQKIYWLLCCRYISSNWGTYGFFSPFKEIKYLSIEESREKAKVADAGFGPATPPWRCNHVSSGL